MLLAPSFLSADFLHLGKAVETINRSEADWLHLDVMDGRFVPNISFGFPIIGAIGKVAEKPMDVHLMVMEPQKYITQLRDLGVATMSVHYEACTHLHRVVEQIKQAGMKASVVLNPHTPVEVLVDILPDVDMILVMSVDPGFSGQKFIPESYQKVKRLRAMIDAAGLNTLIEIDGGMKPERVRQMLEAGADVIVAGNAIFNTPDPRETIRLFKSLEFSD